MPAGWSNTLWAVVADLDSVVKTCICPWCCCLEKCPNLTHYRADWACKSTALQHRTLCYAERFQ